MVYFGPGVVFPVCFFFYFQNMFVASKDMLSTQDVSWSAAQAGGAVGQVGRQGKRKAESDQQQLVRFG